MEPRTGYAPLGDQKIAYQVLGEGPIDVVFSLGFIGSIDVEWEDPAHRSFYEHVASFSRLIRFDSRGTGASDPVRLDSLPPWESFADEIEAVMDAVGSKRAALVVGGPAGPIGPLFAAARPERVTSMVLIQAGVRYLVDEDYPIGWTRDQIEQAQARFGEKWGTGESFDLLVPSQAGNERLRAWYAKWERSITSPGAMQRYQEAVQEIDARWLLPLVQVPTLVIHRPDNEFVPVEWGRYIADNIEGAQMVELPGRDVLPYWENPSATLRPIEEFLTGVRSAPRATRQLATVMFTDIVDSTKRAEALGDRHWRSLLDFHEAAARDVVGTNGGHLIEFTGDGLLATFDGPGRAIVCAEILQDQLARADLHIRSGIHTGEVELRGDGLSGIAVHLAARVMAFAEADEILVSGTVKDLVIGSEMQFQDRGRHKLKGIEGEWHLYATRGRSSWVVDD